MSKNQTGPRNGQWKGGKTLASSGYFLIRVGTEHHLADCRGYAYEHRIVAEEKIGRCLRPGEQVHHINGNKTDNRPENLEVTANIREHRLRHRKHNRNLRMPDEANPLVQCACGCGHALNKYDETGRPRQFITGHNPSPAPTRDRLISILANGPMSLRDITTKSETTLSAIKTCLSKLHKQGIVIRIDHGVYALSGGNNGR